MMGNNVYKTRLLAHMLCSMLACLAESFWYPGQRRRIWACSVMDVCHSGLRLEVSTTEARKTSNLPGDGWHGLWA